MSIQSFLCCAQDVSVSPAGRSDPLWLLLETNLASSYGQTQHNKFYCKETIEQVLSFIPFTLVQLPKEQTTVIHIS